MSSFNAFPAGWHVKEIKDADITIIDGDRGTNYPSKGEFTNEGYCLFLNTGNIRNDCFDFSTCDFITENKDALLRKGKLRRKDIVLTTRGTVGSVGFFHNNVSYEHIRINSGMVVLRCAEVVSPDYSYHLLKSPLLKMQYSLYSSGAAQPQLPIKDLKRIKLPIPPLDVQEKIAAILSAYDELIENNQRRIALLEKMTEEIYREWFVRMRFPDHEKVKKVKGVPDGWNVKQFHEIVEYYIGGGWGEDDQSTTFSEAAFVIRGTDIPDIQAGKFEACPYRFHKPSNLKSRMLQPGDFVFEVSGGSKDQLLGRNVFITEHLLKYFNAPVIAASFCKQIRFRRELVSPYFMKYFMKLYYDYDLVGIYQIQSTGISNYQFESFLKYQTIVLPPDELQKKFEDIVKPIIEMRDGISLANIELRKTRDLLLPRLISGKLPVENLDIQFPPGMEEPAHA